MKNGSTVSKRQLDSAALAVQGELERLGLWGEASRITQAEIYWCWFPQFLVPGALGFLIHEDDLITRTLGYEAGNIYIPHWVLLHGLWQRRGSLRDVIRHEYGHAIAHYYPALIPRSSRFAAAFGGGYWLSSSVGGESDEFVSLYAQGNPAEDFAETFMFFVRHGGRIPARFRSPAVRRKWRFVADLVAAIRRGRARW